MNNVQVIVAGAGMGGLSLGIALQRAGIPVTLYDQAPELSEVGAGIMLTPNANQALTFLGVEDRIAKMAQRPGATRYRAYDTGDVLTQVNFDQAFLSRYNGPFLTLHRAELQMVLKDAVLANDKDAIKLDHVITGYEVRGDKVVAKFANGNEAVGDLLVGADGSRSVLRGQVVKTTPPRFTGNVAWRGLVPIERLAPKYRTPDTEIWVGRKQHVVDYTVKKGAFLNYVAITESADWNAQGWNVPSTIDELLGEFPGWHEDFLNMVRNTPPELCAKWALLDHDPLPYWTKGHVTLLGDAAHPTLPFMAQGAAMAIEDAVVLGRALANIDGLGNALAAYEKTRKERASYVQLHSRFFAELYHRQASQQELSEKRSAANDVLYSYNAATAPLA